MNTQNQTENTTAKTPRKPRASYRLLGHFDLDRFGLKIETIEQGKVTDTLILWSPVSIDIDVDYTIPYRYVHRQWIALVQQYSAIRFSMDSRKDLPNKLSDAVIYLENNDVLLESIDASLPKEKEPKGKAAENLQMALLVNELRAELAEARKENLELTRRLMTYLERNGA